MLTSSGVVVQSGGYGSEPWEWVGYNRHRWGTMWVSSRARGFRVKVSSSRSTQHGGSWGNSSSYVRPARRMRCTKRIRQDHKGFRVVI